MRTTFTLLAGTLLLRATVQACDCSIWIPGTFCETLDPEWNVPNAVVLGVKLDDVYYGMHVKVLEVFDGNVAEGDTLTVWGDNGALCRHYAGTWNVGDTIVWGFHDTDFMGNFITAGFPPDLEQPGDYHISSCGTYWVGYSNGLITGPIAPGVTSIAVPVFWSAMEECLATGISETSESSGLRVAESEGGPWLSMNDLAAAALTITDASGKRVLTRNWDGAPLQLRGFAAGAYTVQVRTGERQWARKVVIR